jgi:hypothetical protein
MNKIGNVKSLDLLQPLIIPEGAWQCISMDFITSLLKSEGKIIIFVVMDRFVKYALSLSLTHTHPFLATDVVNIFMDNIYKLHRLPLYIVSDRDAVFTSKF